MINDSDILLMVKELQIVELHPGDVIIVKVHDHVSINQANMETIKNAIKAKFPRNEVLVIHGADIDIMRNPPSAEDDT